MNKKILSVFICLLLVFEINYAQKENTIERPANLVSREIKPRQIISLDGTGWRVWLDEKAEWENDSLFAPGEFILTDLPVNQPTCKWAGLQTKGIPCEIPVCIEQVFANGNATYLYHGVSWVYRTIDIPADWKGKVIRLKIARARLRVELYINEKLAGYDLCCETPVEFDLSGFLDYTNPNRIAIRITNPGGSRGFDDCPQIPWGKYRLPSGRDFAGIDNISLTATNPVYIADVFVLNQLPAEARNVNIKITIQNSSAEPVKRNISAKVEDVEKSLFAELKPGENTFNISMSVPDAKLWDIDKPNLYNCMVSISEKDKLLTDNYSTTFGFRVFEVKQNADGKSCFYLNGKRFRHRSAIDWGFYAHTGFFATEEMAERTVLAAKNIGHNGINLHRHIGEYRVLEAADKYGISIYEEPGGLHQWQGDDPVKEGSLSAKLLQEKVRRMALRDRNHPSLLIHNLSNEDNYWGPIREKAMLTINQINPAVLVSNSSGHAGSGEIQNMIPYKHAQPSGPVNHIRPYENTIRNDFQDDHTVGSTAFFDESSFNIHTKNPGKDLLYFGEVFCHTGPANWWLVAEQQKESTAGSYDNSTFEINHNKIEKAFIEWNLSKVGSRIISSPADITLQAGRSLMYTDGRLSQRIMANNAADGYAINGWSAHSYCANSGDNWDSALLDEGRNLKGPAEDYLYWVRPLQVAIFRKNGKYFKPADTAKFEVCIINEGIIPGGIYNLKIDVTDGIGKKTNFSENVVVNLKGGDNYSEPIEEINMPLLNDWHAGYITVSGELFNSSGKSVASGKDQVLLSNRATFKNDIKGIPIAVSNWDAAKSALTDADAIIVNTKDAKIVLAGKIPDDAEQLIKSVYSGTVLIIKFDSLWAELLYKQNILSNKVNQWGGTQSNQSMGWFGNGWGYLDNFTGNQSVPSKTIIGTNSWEVPGSPYGFYPFESKYNKAAYGLYFARQNVNGKETNPTLLVLMGTIDYGKGKIVLMPLYPIDEENPFNDMLFFNTIAKSGRREW